MLRIREKMILDNLERDFGLLRKDGWPNGSSVRDHVRQALYDEAIAMAARKSILRWQELGGDEDAWEALCRDELGEEPNGEDKPEPSRIHLPQGMQQAMAFQEKMSLIKGGQA